MKVKVELEENELDYIINKLIETTLNDEYFIPEEVQQTLSIVNKLQKKLMEAKAKDFVEKELGVDYIEPQN